MRINKFSLLICFIMLLIGCSSTSSSGKKNSVMIDSIVFNENEMVRNIKRKNNDNTKFQYTLVFKEQTEIEFTIKLDNPEAYGIDALRIKCDDQDAEILLEGEWKNIAQEDNGTRVVNWSSEDPYEKTYKIRTSSLDDINIFEVVDIRLSGHDKFLSKYTNSSNFGNNKFSIYKINADAFKFNILYNNFENIKFSISSEEYKDKINNIKVNGFSSNADGFWVFSHNDMKEKAYKYEISFDYLISAENKIHGTFSKCINPFDGSIDGVVYKENDTYISVIGYTDDVPNNITILKSLFNKPVTTIEAKAFENCAKLLSVRIPDTIEVIGDYAFINCKLAVFYFEASSIPQNTSTIWENTYCPIFFGINENNFVENDSLQFVVQEGNAILSKSLSEDENIVIPDTININSIEYPVRTIAMNSFSDCSKTTSVRIPNSVVTIEQRAFDDCVNLKEVLLDSDNNVKTIGEMAFIRCEKLTSVSPMMKLETLGRSVFAKCKSLKTFSLPNSLISIGATLFSNCESLENVYYYGSIEEWNNIEFVNDDPKIYGKHFYVLDENDNWYEIQH